MEIVKRSEHPLLGRERVTAKLQAEGATPSRLALTRRLATALKAKEETVAIRHVFTRYGSQELKVIAHVYKDAAKKAQLEKANNARLAKQAEKEEKANAEKKKAEEEAKAAAEAAAAEASAEDAPAEEAASEEAPAEEKPAEEGA